APVARCRNRSFTITEGETLTINAGQIDDRSFDGCGALAGGGIDVSSFTCANEGPNTVTLTVGDLNGNASSCTATVNINVRELVMEGEDDNCLSETFSLQGGQTINDLVFDGQLIGQVSIGANAIDAVQVDVYKSNNRVENLGLSKYLSKRISLTMLNSGSEVQPNTEPVYVRLYYSREELDALLAADPAASESTLTVVKTDNDDCGTGYEGFNATTMNTTAMTAGCTGADRFLEFFTGTFSTFYLFSTNAVLPVELSEFTATVLPKQRVQLDWRTLTEDGNSHFDVERSTDGRTFALLGAVAGAGDSSEEQWYDYVDENAATGVNYYRLRQVDLDGTETLSEVRQVTVESAVNLRVYPNPAAAELWIDSFAGGPVRVLNLQGQVVLQQTLVEGESLDVRRLPAGGYVLRTAEGNLRWVKK
ncbi:MAG: T9SS type A sorting domain-containing protein, partial [Bacteroidota bacterium]